MKTKKQSPLALPFRVEAALPDDLAAGRDFPTRKAALSHARRLARKYGFPATILQDRLDADGNLVGLDIVNVVPQ